MNKQDLTIVCPAPTDPICLRPDGKRVWASVTPEDINSGTPRINVCPTFFDPYWTPDEEDIFFASPGGVLLHEVAHLAGAWSDDSMGYKAVRELAQTIPRGSHVNADSFHYYIFNNRFD